MFHLVKILYSSTNQPETIRVPGIVGESYKRSQPMKLQEGKLAKIGSGEMPTHMTMETKTVKKDGETVLCYEINSNMVFNTVCQQDINGSLLGRVVNLFGGRDRWNGILTEDGGVATIHDPKNAKKPGDIVQIRFI